MWKHPLCLIYYFACWVFYIYQCFCSIKIMTFKLLVLFVACSCCIIENNHVWEWHVHRSFWGPKKDFCTWFSFSQHWFCFFRCFAHTSFVLSAYTENIRHSLYQVLDLETGNKTISQLIHTIYTGVPKLWGRENTSPSPLVFIHLIFYRFCMLIFWSHIQIRHREICYCSIFITLTHITSSGIKLDTFPH